MAPPQKPWVRLPNGFAPGKICRMHLSAGSTATTMPQAVFTALAAYGSFAACLPAKSLPPPFTTCPPR
ncbi:hypothetical protein KM92DES2_12436 [uncultured Desulfovibrio sp.]|uniref:Uncharacterized protein n=1 Tax=uncultured Desulfovibrio sp. TaxID=167968 RepID=A0A212K8U7_9BACT|nr:hypothetical protein KM92DES2_12436 [uncultured Desulfovibrio sp.]